MKQFVITVLMAITGISATAQKSETRKSGNFNTLEVKNGIEVIFTQSTETSLKVESDNEANLENIITEFRKGCLKIYMNESSSEKPFYGTARVYVSAANTSAFQVSRGASVKVNGKLQADDINIRLSTGSSFTAEVNSKKCTVKAESGSIFRGFVNTELFDGKSFGGSSLKITGNSETTNIFCNGGSLLAGKFLSQKAGIKTINASAAFITAVKSINADADMSSSITYYGEPTDVNIGSNMCAIKRDNLKLALNK